MSETFDDDLWKEINQPDHTEEEYETQNCDLYEVSGCCGAAIGWPDSDICSDCRDHSSPTCNGCEHFDICINEDKVTV